MTDLQIAADAQEFVELAAAWIARELCLAVEERGRASIALAGGSTPQPVHARLSTFDLPWDCLTFFFGDERCVPPDDLESNFGQAQRALFAKLRDPHPRVVRMEGEDPDREAAARRYAERLPPALDVLILGIGDDAHTLSLFPQSQAIDEEVRRVIAVQGPKPPFARLTITAPVVRAARRVLMLDAGASKAAATRRALEGDEPVRAVPARLARGRTWILDRAAAAELSRHPR